MIFNLVRHSKTRKIQNITSGGRSSLVMIRGLIALGHDVVIKDEKGVDVTSEVLTAALHDAEKNRKMSVEWLKQQIKDYEMLNR